MAGQSSFGHMPVNACMNACCAVVGRCCAIDRLTDILPHQQPTLYLISCGAGMSGHKLVNGFLRPSKPLSVDPCTSLMAWQLDSTARLLQLHVR